MNSTDPNTVLPRRVKLLSFNVGLLRAFGGLLQPAAYVAERAAQLPKALCACGADVIILQEIYSRTHRRALVQQCHPTLPFVYGSPEPHVRLGAGLVVLSRIPFAASFISFRAGVVEEKLWGPRGMLVIRFTDFSIIGFHVTSGGLRRHPESFSSEYVRAQQIGELLTVAQSENAIVLAGDLNAGPGVSQVNYDQVTTAGYLDCLAACGKPDDATWDPLNPLNLFGPHRTSPAQRCDHIFIRGSVVDEKIVTLSGASVVFRETVVGVDGRRVTLSDHYGVMATLRVRPRSTAASAATASAVGGRQ
jgi:endonuclease/exonuclease/phosphatase family metal-dependent hydrolase